jgi:sulfopyruvate decarboxylase subunit beta
MIDQLELMRVLERLRGDAVVMPVFRANLAWNQVSNNPVRDVPIGTAEFPAVMGIGSSFALGLSLARPETKVILFDGDGSLLMNLGSLVTVANKAPKNLYHFVMDNGVYATTGGQDTPGTNPASYTEMASAAGYTACYEFDELEDFTGRAEEVMGQEGPVMICVKTVPNIRGPRDQGPPVSDEVMANTSSAQSRPQAITNLLAEFGAD